MDGSRETGQIWTGTYRNHRIAVKRRDTDWQVFLDANAIADESFETTDEAIAWLRRRVDGMIAEQIFPGLSLAHFNSAS